MDGKGKLIDEHKRNEHNILNYSNKAYYFASLFLNVLFCNLMITCSVLVY